MSPLTAALLGVAFILVIIWIILLEVPSLRTYRMFNKLPGPKGYPIIGNALILANVQSDEEIMDIFAYYIHKYPRVVAIWLMGLPSVIITHPNDLQTLMTNVHNIKKGYEYGLLDQWLNTGLLLSYGNKWHTRRKALTPAFHFKILASSLQVMIKNSNILVHKLLATKGENIELEKYVSLCTLDIMAEASMGINIDAQSEKNKDYVNSILIFSKTVVYRILNPWFLKEWIFSFEKKYKTYLNTIKMLHNFSINVIRERKKVFTLPKFKLGEESHYYRKQHVALLDCLLELEAKNPGSFTENDIREEVDTFLFRGHESTTTAIGFSLFCIANHPHVQERLYEEQERILKGEKRDITLQDLSEMVYLEKVIKETLRLYPSVPYFSRRLTEDLILTDGTIIPSGVQVSVLPFFTHRRKDIYPDPETFNPERFSEQECENRHPFAYIPFSAGPRNCIGQKFAMLELKTVLSSIIRNLTIEPVTKKEDFKLIPYLILRPSKPIMVKLTPRT